MEDVDQGVAEGHRRLRVVAFGTFDQHQHPRVGVLIETLENLGHAVLQCNEPLGISTEARVRVAREPWRALPLVLQLASAWWKLVRQSRRIGRHAADVVLVGYLGVLDVHLARICFRAPIVLDHMAPVAGIGKDRSLPFVPVLSVLDQLAERQADVVIWDTTEQVSSAARNKSGTVVRVGASGAWFEQKRRQKIPHSPVSICFFGVYTPLQGATIIARAILLMRDRVDLRWTLIGKGQDRAGAETIVGSTENVRWIDWLDEADLRKTVADHDVCLGIFGNTPKAMRVVPNKVYQGAAAGCAVITSNTQPQRTALGDAGTFVTPADPAALAKAITTFADDRILLSRMKEACRSRAEEHFSPQALGSEMQQVLDLAGRTRRSLA